MPVNIKLTFLWAPTIANVGRYIDDFERRQKTILDAIFQAIDIYRLAKIIYVGNILSLFWGCGHANLGCRGEILQDLPPIAFLLG